MTMTNCPMCEWEIPGELSQTIKSCAECGADLSRWTRRRIKPPPIPVHVERAQAETSGGEWFARQASTLSLVAPFVAAAVNSFSRHVIVGNRVALMTVGCTTLLLILSGFLLGVVALVLPKK